MKKKILLPILSLLNCVCLILMCTTLTGCGEDSTLSEADSQLFQIACNKIKMTSTSGSLDTANYAGLVCEYDEEKYGTKVLATEIRSNGYNTPYAGSGNPLSFTVTFVTKNGAATNTKMAVSTAMSFTLENHSLAQDIANYIYCSTDMSAKKNNNCQGIPYSKQAINAEDFVNLVKSGSFNGHSFDGHKIPDFTIYNVGTAVNHEKNGLKDLTIIKVVSNDSYHQEATTVSATQKQMCQVALSKLVSTFTATHPSTGDEITAYRNAAAVYMRDKMQGAAIAEDSNPVFAGHLVDDFFNGEPDYKVLGNVTQAGCQASISLTLKNTYQYTATITFNAQYTKDGNTETWNLVDGAQVIDLNDTTPFIPGLS